MLLGAAAGCKAGGRAPTVCPGAADGGVPHGVRLLPGLPPMVMTTTPSAAMVTVIVMLAMVGWLPQP